jgi:hypothetical protein
MRYSSGCALFSMGAVTALAMLVAALEVSDAAIPVARGIDPLSINRTFKGDRSPAPSRVPGQSASEPKLPEGCVPAAEWWTDIYSDEVAGRCVV